MFDPADNSGQNLHPVPAALFSGLTKVADPMAVMAQGVFSLPVDSETTDTESMMARLVKPFHIILSCIAWATWRSVTARRTSIPLYLYYRSLLC